jgi:ABC-type transport system involved in cytochrome bd biosynthesis fused ATPase/permease subunit
VREQWETLSLRQKTGGALTLLAIVLTFVLATTSNGTGATPLLLAVFAAVAQFAASLLFAGHGKVNPSQARRSAERLLALARRAGEAEALARDAQERTYTVVQMRKRFGEVGVHLSYLEEGAIEATKDWLEVHPDAVSLPEEGDGNGN